MRKKVIISLIIAVLTTFLLVGCTKSYKVTFKYGNGQQDLVKEVLSGKTVEKPLDPTREGYIFQYWETEDSKKFDFLETKIKKDTTLKAKWEEKTTGLKVTLPENVTATNPAINLNEITKGTEIEFKITVPKNYYVKNLLANTADILSKLSNENKFKLVINSDITIKVTFAVNKSIEEEVNAELGKVTDIKIKKLESEPELTLEEIKTKIEEKVNLELVKVEVTKKDEKYEVKLTSKKVEELVVTKEITVTYEKLSNFKVTLSQKITAVDSSVDLNNVVENTELEFLVNIPSGKVIDKLTANGKDIKNLLTTENKFKLVIKEDTKIEVTFTTNQEILQEVETELSKINDLTIELQDEQVELSIEELKQKLEEKVESTLVTLELTKNSANYTVKLISKKDQTVFREKQITVTYNKFYTVTVPAEITVEGTQNLAKVLAGTKLTFVVAVPENKKVSTLTANGQDIKSTLTAENKFEYTVNEKVTFAVTFDERVKYNVTLPSEITIENYSELQFYEGTKLIFIVAVPEDYVVATLTANGQDIKSTLTAENKFEYTVNENVIFAVTFQIDSKIQTQVEDELEVIPDEIEIFVEEGVQELPIETLVEKVKKIIDVEIVTVEVIKNETDYKIVLKSVKFPEITAEKNVTFKLINESVKVTIDLKGGTYQGKTGIIELLFSKGTKIGEILITRPGYNFLGLYKETELYDTNQILEAPINLEARWEDVFITYEKNGKVFIQGVVKENDVQDLKIPGIIDGKEVEILGKAFIDNFTIKTLEIEEGVKKIGLMAFYNVKYLHKVKLPQSLEYIGNRAFSKTQISDLRVPRNVKDIDYKAFSPIQSLENVVFENEDFFGFDSSTFINTPFYEKSLVDKKFYVINNSLVALKDTQNVPGILNLPVGTKGLGRAVLSKLNGITEIRNTESLVYIGDEALYKLSGLQKIALTENIRYIGSSAFEGITSLQNINLPEGLEFLGNSAFKGTSLTAITIPSTLKEIPNEAFAEVTVLSNIVFNDQIERIGEKAFKDTAWLNTEKEKGFVIVNNILISAEKPITEEIIVPNNVVRISGGTFDNLNTKKIFIPNTVKAIDQGAIKNMGSLEQLSINANTKLENFAITYDRKDGMTIKIFGANSLPQEWPVKWITKYADPNKLNVVFATEITITFNLNGATSESIPSQQIFEGQTIVLPPNPVKPNSLFVGWKKANGEMFIENESLYTSQELVAEWLEKNELFEIKIQNFQVEIIKLKNVSETEIIVPNSISGYPVVKIAANAFKDKTELTKITLPETIVEIGEGAFENTGLTEFVVPNLVTKLNSNLFLNSNNLKTINIHQNVNEIGINVFEGTKWLEEQRTNNQNLVIVNEILVDASQLTGDVTVPANVKVINTNAFKATTATSITILEGVSKINTNALNQTSTVGEIIIPKSVETIEANAFNVETLSILIPTRYSAATGFADNWDQSLNGKHAVKYKSAQFFKVSINGSHTVLTSGIELENVLGGTIIEVRLNVQDNNIVSKLTINGQDKLDILDKVTNTLTLLVEDNLNIEFEEIKDPAIVLDFETEFAKLTGPLYFGQGIRPNHYKKDDLINDQVKNLVDILKVGVEVQKVTGSEDKYNVTLTSRRDPSYQKTVELPVVIVPTYQPYSKNYGTMNKDEWSGGAKSYYFTSKNIVNYQSGSGALLNYRWRSLDEGFDLDRRYAVIQIEKTIDLRLIWVRSDNEYPGMPKTYPEYKIYVANTTGFPTENDWVEAAHVVSEKGHDNSVATFKQGTTANYVKFVILKSHPDNSENQKNYFSINHVGIFGFAELADVEFDLNGGNIQGSTENPVVKVEKGGKINFASLPRATKENYVLDYYEKDGRKIDPLNTIINENCTIKIIWKVDPNLYNVIGEELNKVKNKFVVETDGEITLELVKEKAKTFVNNDLVDLEVTFSEDNKYTIKLIHKEITTVFQEKQVVVLKRNVGETVEVRFVLNGGKIENSSEDVIVNVLKGEVIGDKLPQNPEKQYYNFVGWQKIDEDLADFSTIEFYEGQTFTAKYEIKPEILSGVNLQLLKIDDELGIEEEISIESIKLYIESLLDNQKYEVLVEVTSTENKTHKITIISKELSEVKNSKEIYVNKLVQLTYPETIKIDGKTSPSNFVLGTTKQLYIDIPASKQVKNLIVNSVNVTSDLDNNRYNLIIPEKLTIELELEANQQFIENFENKLNVIGDKIALSTSEVNLVNVTEKVNEILVETDVYEIEVSHVHGITYIIKIVSKVDSSISAKKVVNAYIIGSLNSYISKRLKKGVDYSNQITGEKAEYAFDTKNNEPNKNTKWCTNVKPTTPHYLIMSLDKPRKITGFELTNAGISEEQGYNTKSFRLLGSNNKKTGYVELYQEQNNKKTVVKADINVEEEYQYIKLEILQGEQNGFTVRIYDITLYGIKDDSLEVSFDYNGGELNGANKSSIMVKKTELIGLERAPKPTRENYNFVKWVLEKNNEDFNLNQNVLKNTKLKAIWEEKTAVQSHIVTFNLSGGNSSDETTQLVENQQYATPIQVTKPGYRFVEWRYNGVKFEFETTQITENIELVAHFELEEYVIEYVLNDGTNSLENPQNYTIETETIVLKPASKEGLNFVGWFKEATFETQVTQIEKGSTGNIKLYAKFQ